MAFASATNANARFADGHTPASAKGSFVDVITGCTAGEQSDAQLARPLAATATTTIPLGIGAGVTRVMLRAKYATAISAAATAPVVKLVGTDKPPAESVEGTATPFPIHDVDISDTGLTLPMDPTNDLRDGTFKYGAWVSLTAKDLLGAETLLVLLDTNASVTGGTDVRVQAYLIN